MTISGIYVIQKKKHNKNIKYVKHVLESLLYYFLSGESQVGRTKAIPVKHQRFKKILIYLYN